MLRPTDAAVDHLLEAVDVAGEHGHDHAALGVAELVDEGFADLALAHGVAGALDVGAFAQQGQHARVPRHGQGTQVGDLAVHGGKVDLEVAGMHDHACGTGNDQRAGAGDGVAYLDELDRERADLDLVPGLDGVHLNAVHPVFPQL